MDKKNYNKTNFRKKLIVTISNPVAVTKLDKKMTNYQSQIHQSSVISKKNDKFFMRPPKKGKKKTFITARKSLIKSSTFAYLPYDTPIHRYFSKTQALLYQLFFKTSTRKLIGNTLYLPTSLQKIFSVLKAIRKDYRLRLYEAVKNYQRKHLILKHFIFKNNNFKEKIKILKKDIFLRKFELRKNFIKFYKKLTYRKRLVEKRLKKLYVFHKSLPEILNRKNTIFNIPHVQKRIRKLENISSVKKLVGYLYSSFNHYLPPLNKTLLNKRSKLKLLLFHFGLDYPKMFTKFENQDVLSSLNISNNLNPVFLKKKWKYEAYNIICNKIFDFKTLYSLYSNSFRSNFHIVHPKVSKFVVWKPRSKTQTYLPFYEDLAVSDNPHILKVKKNRFYKATPKTSSLASYVNFRYWKLRVDSKAILEGVETLVHFSSSRSNFFLTVTKRNRGVIFSVSSGKLEGIKMSRKKRAKETFERLVEKLSLFLYDKSLKLVSLVVTSRELLKNFITDSHVNSIISGLSENRVYVFKISFLLKRAHGLLPRAPKMRRK